MKKTENKAEKLKWGFTLGGTLFGILCFSAFPMLSTWGTLSSGAYLFFTREAWKEKSVNIAIKFLLGAAIYIVGLLIGASAVPAQLAAGLLFSSALSYFFITECVIYPQQKHPIRGKKITLDSVLDEMKQYDSAKISLSASNCYQALENYFENSDQSEPTKRQALVNTSNELFKEVRSLIMCAVFRNFFRARA